MTDPSKIVEDVLAAGKKISGADVTANVTHGLTKHVRFGKGMVSSTGDVDVTTLYVRVAFGKRAATASTTSTDSASIASLLERAAAIAKLTPEDPEELPLLGASKQALVANPNAFDKAWEKFAADDRAAIAKAGLQAGDDAQLQVAGYLEHDIWWSALGNSAGLRATDQQTDTQLTMTARTAVAGDGVGSGWGGQRSPRAAELDAKRVIATAVDKGKRSANPQKLDPGKYTVVLEPQAVGELITWLSFFFDARSADEGRSAFSKPGGGNRIGEKMFGDQIVLRSDPGATDNPCSPWDGEGVAIQPTTWIDKGVLTALPYSRFWAQKQGKTPTGGVDAFTLAGGTATEADLLKDVKKGVLITRLHYLRLVDPQTLVITGMTRDGTFLIENGEVTAPVNNFRFNVSPVTMLMNTDLLTRDVVTVAPPQDGGKIRVPALRTHEFNLTSVSGAT
jgi:predicted Zn-dependent protease